MLTTKLDVLPAAQRALWPELRQTPRSFVLYGGTAMALRLGHRQSLDFDFFSNESFAPADLLLSVRYLKEGRIDQRTENTFSVTIDRNGPVQISFFGNASMRCVQVPDIASENEVQIASLLDLTATKLKTIQQRAEAKDYIDIAAALSKGVTLPEALGAATAIYGKTFNAVAALKALSYFEDGNLPTIPKETQQRLTAAAQRIALGTLLIPASMPDITRGERSL